MRKARRQGPGRKVLAAAVSAVVSLGVAEGACRLWVAHRWPPAKVEQLTHHSPVRGAYRADPVLGYALTPGHTTSRVHHNSRGFRGREFPAVKEPGTVRVVLAGASTVYGPKVRDGETSAARLEQILRSHGLPAEVINAGVPGWTSLETVASLRTRLLPLEPDAVLFLDGRNELFPQLFNNYRDDYTHFRDPDCDIARTHYYHKILFRWSHFTMLLFDGIDDILGYHGLRDNPAYAAIRFENQPGEEQVRENARDPARCARYAANLREEIQLCREQEVIPLLATMPFRAEEFRSGVLPRIESCTPVFQSCVDRNNDLVRAVAREGDATLVDLAALATPENLVDDCHFNARGEELCAALIAEKLMPLLENAPESRN